MVGRGSSVQSLGSSTQPAPATASRLQLSQTSRSQSAAGWSETWRLHQWEASAAETAVCTAGTGPGGGAGRPFTPAGAGVGGMVQLSWRVKCRVLHSGACHNTLCPSCHTRPRPPARTSCAQSPGPRHAALRAGSTLSTGPGWEFSCQETTCHDNHALSFSVWPRPDNPH